VVSADIFKNNSWQPIQCFFNRW